MEALQEFRVPVEHQPEDPSILPYLQSEDEHVYDIDLTVSIQPENDEQSYIVSQSNAKYLYWTFNQQLVHHTSTGCNVNAGDLMGTGTISGPVS